MHAFSGIWEGFHEAAANALKEGRAFVNASAIYAEAVSKSASPAALEGIAETHTSHPTDSHPPLSERLRSLRVGLADVASAALVVTPSQPATALVPELERHEEELSDAYQRLLAGQLGLHGDKEEGAQAGSGA